MAHLYLLPLLFCFVLHCSACTALLCLLCSALLRSALLRSAPLCSHCSVRTALFCSTQLSFWIGVLYHAYWTQLSFWLTQLHLLHLNRWSTSPLIWMRLHLKWFPYLLDLWCEEIFRESSLMLELISSFAFAIILSCLVVGRHLKGSKTGSQLMLSTISHILTLSSLLNEAASDLNYIHLYTLYSPLFNTCGRSSLDQ